MLLLDIVVAAGCFARRWRMGCRTTAPAQRAVTYVFEHWSCLYDEHCGTVTLSTKKLVSYTTLARCPGFALGPRLGWLWLRAGSKDVKRAALDPLCHCRAIPPERRRLQPQGNKVQSAPTGRFSATRRPDAV